jgi:hypothetical protein
MTEARKASAIVRRLAQLALPLAAAAALLGGVVALGRHLGDRGPALTFREVECEPPEGMTRQQFLEEAEYLSGLPDRIGGRDVTAQVHAALAKHPWVLRVAKVRRLPGGRVRADIEYRRPVLAVEHPPREVDAEGVLLPRSGRRKGLPLLRTKVVPPAGKPGEPWSDVRVVAAAQVVALVQSRLALAECTVEVDEGEVVLRTPRFRLLWGRPPGQEKAAEASAAEKLNRLPDAAALAGKECDLRPSAGPKQRPMTP